MEIKNRNYFTNTENLKYLILCVNNEYYVIDFFPNPVIFFLGVYKNKFLKFNAFKLSSDQYEKYMENRIIISNKKIVSLFIRLFPVVVFGGVGFVFLLQNLLIKNEMIISYEFASRLIIFLYLFLILFFSFFEIKKEKNIKFDYKISFYLKKELSFQKEFSLGFANLILTLTSHFHLLILAKGLFSGFISMYECLAICASILLMLIFSLVPPSLSSNDVYISQTKD